MLHLIDVCLKDLIKQLEGKDINAGVGFANKIVERKGETYVEDKVVESGNGWFSPNESYFNFSKYNS